MRINQISRRCVIYLFVDPGKIVLQAYMEKEDIVTSDETRGSSLDSHQIHQLFMMTVLTHSSGERE